MGVHRLGSAWALAIGSLMAMGAGTAVAAATYNATTQFSGHHNPAGVWSYHAGGKLLTHPSGSGPKTPGWSNGKSTPDSASMFANRTGKTMVVNRNPPTTNGDVILPGWIAMDPQSIPSISVQWTAPAAGTYHVVGAFRGNDTAVAKYGAAHGVAIDHNAANIYTNTISQYNQRDSFNLTVQVKRGDRLTFLVKTSPTTYQFLNTGLLVKISTG
jgi:hypothetical protein